MDGNEDSQALNRGDVLPTDLRLARRAGRGDVAAFHALVDRYASYLFALAVSLVGNAADAEDIVQETLTGAYRGLGAFEERSSVKTWLTRILVRQAARHRQRSMRRGSYVVQSDAALASASGRASTSDTDTQIDVAAAVRSLSPEHRDVIVLREFQGMSYDEIAQVLAIPRGTVESRLYRARRRLQQFLRDYLA